MSEKYGKEAQEEFDQTAEEEEFYGHYLPLETPWWMRKAVSVLLSLGFHGLIALVAAYALFAIVQPKPEVPAILAQREIIPPPFDKTRPRGIIRQDAVEGEKTSERSYKILQEEVEVTKDIPRGTTFDAISDKNLGSTSGVDAYGIGGTPAGAYGQRWGRGRLPYDSGGPPTESAVLAALLWLHFHQDPNGMWDQDGFDKNCDTRKGPKCDNPNFLSSESNQYDVGVSALALLAFLGNGHTHRVGDFKKTVRRGLDWLLSQQQSDGSFGSRIAESWIYNHALATMAVCEAYAITRDSRLKDPAQRAVEFIRNAQNPGLGWKYEPRDGKCDTSVTGWMVLALKAASTARLEVPKELYDGSIAWFDRVTNPAGKTGYMKQGDDGSVIRGVNESYGKMPTMTSVGIICRIFCGQPRGDRKVLQGVDILMANLPDWNKPKNDKVDYYYWYYGTYAMFQYGGEKWQKWNEAMKKALLGTQRQGGCADGSWDPIDKWGMVGGRVYATALNCLTLEIYYRYARAHEGPNTPRPDMRVIRESR